MFIKSLKAYYRSKFPDWSRLQRVAAPILGPPPVKKGQPIAYVPFVPLGRKPPIYFVHIPKTAGSSVNNAFRSAYGHGNSVIHIEDKLADLVSGKEPAIKADFVSGHYAGGIWDLRPSSKVYRKITFFRDPWERLVSHINWVDSYQTRMATLPDLEHVLDCLRTVDFSDKCSMTDFFEKVFTVERTRPFDNYQLRLIRPNDLQTMRRRILPKDVDTAVAYLDTFMFFGFSDDLEKELNKLNRIAEIRPRLRARYSNPGRTARLTADNALAREVFAEWWEYDRQFLDKAQVLYREKFGS